MKYSWIVQPEQDQSTGRWGATWRTDEMGAEGAPVYSGHVGAVYDTAAAARGHAAMWIARMEDAQQPALVVAPLEEQWQPTADELADALAAHRSTFRGGPGITLGA